MDLLREPVNSITHFIGMIAAAILFPFIILKSTNHLEIISLSIFLIGLIGLYGTSAIYHGIKGSEKTLHHWRLADHIMIYILIAATYTPICLLYLKGVFGIVLLSVIWLLTILGIIAKTLWLNMPRKLYTGLYIGLGWAAIFAIYPLLKTVGLIGVILLVSGGVSYTVGGIIYAKKPVTPFKYFGFHEIFHLFILLGSLFHAIMIFAFSFN